MINIHSSGALHVYLIFSLLTLLTKFRYTVYVRFLWFFNQFFKAIFNNLYLFILALVFLATQKYLSYLGWSNSCTFLFEFSETELLKNISFKSSQKSLVTVSFLNKICVFLNDPAYDVVDRCILDVCCCVMIDDMIFCRFWVASGRSADP